MYGPTVGVNSSRARMEVYSPDIAFKTPTVGIAYGDAYTAGPANYDTEAVTGAALQGPKISLDAPAASAFRLPRDTSLPKLPRTGALSRRPAITRFTTTPLLT